MNNISMDSQSLKVTDFDISPDTDLDIKPCMFSPKTGEIKGRELELFNGYRGQKAVLNFDNGMGVDLAPDRQGNLALFIHFCNGRVLTGNNYNLLSYPDIQHVFEKVESDSYDKGIKYNIQEAELLRCDVARHVYPEEKTQNYFPTLQLLGMGKTQRRDFFDKNFKIESVGWYGDEHEIQFYDKCLEMKKNARKKRIKYKAGDYPQTIRCEQRLLTGRKVRDFLGITKIKDITPEAFHHIQEKYISNLKKYQFRFNAEEIQVISQKGIENELIQFQNRFGKRYLNAYFRKNGFDWIKNNSNIEIFLSAVRNVDKGHRLSKNMKICRLRAEYREMIQFDNFLQGDLFEGKTSSQLYTEFRNKILAVA